MRRAVLSTVGWCANVEKGGQDDNVEGPGEDDSLPRCTQIYPEFHLKEIPSADGLRNWPPAAKMRRAVLSTVGWCANVEKGGQDDNGEGPGEDGE
ncbi:hypothetical protein CDAR_65361 [Caerostris darwini]|uniref:Uncharacterized protein n=1 Tax=Caerostris darwini TaxID=1538125 RepID=A0AAV4W730_9ARAC|nr:hypothetical protein CDAR_65361 [Caerostris darwini]